MNNSFFQIKPSYEEIKYGLVGTAMGMATGIGFSSAIISGNEIYTLAIRIPLILLTALFGTYLGRGIGQGVEAAHHSASANTEMARLQP